MSYSDPPEWRGRHPASREGWPTNGGHRYREAEPYNDRRPGESFDDDMPTDPIGPEQLGRARYQQGRVAAGVDDGTRRLERVAPAVAPVVHLLDREPEGLPRMALWLGIIRDMAVIALCLVGMWVGGMIIARHGVPLWVPK